MTMKTATSTTACAANVSGSTTPGPMAAGTPASITTTITTTTTTTNTNTNTTSTSTTRTAMTTTTTTPATTTGAASVVATNIMAASTKSTLADANLETDTIGPIVKRAKVRPTPFSKPILLTADRPNRKKKSITWQSDEKIQKVHYFELIADERINVTRDLNSQSNVAANNDSALTGQPLGTSPNAHANRLNQSPLAMAMSASEARNEANARSHEGFKRREWRLILIDFNNDHPGPSQNSIERIAQAERENYVLGAIDLPGQPSTIDEPDNNESSNVLRDEQGVKIIPLDNPDGSFCVYPDLSNSEIVNGIRMPPVGSQPFNQDNMATPFNNSGQPQHQFMPNSTLHLMNNINWNPFSFQEMSAQFQQQQQQPQPFPFLQQQQQPQQLQQFQSPFITQPQQMQKK